MKMLRQPDRAYYVAIWRKARSYKVDMARKQWCDYSHQHFDWDGLGNKSWLDRRRHLAVLLHAFRRAQVELTSFEDAYQVFASVKPADSASDAVYVHTPNPNQTPYPMTPLGEEVLSLPPLLASRIDLSRYRVFRYGSGKDASFTILAARVALR
ncbi:hypothetical protein [Roseateles sp. P5_E1]